MRDRRMLFGTASILALSAAALLVGAPAAEARVTRIQITEKQSPTFGGYVFKDVGAYEKIVGKAYGELDPKDPKNAVIVDIQLAPKNARGNVEYAFDFYILKPIDLSKGDHKAMYEPPNRGGKTHGPLNRGAGGDDPGSVTDPKVLANTFLLPRGYTMIWSGWDYSAGLQQRRLQHHDHVARRQESGRLHDHRTRLRIHRGAGRRRTSELSRGDDWTRARRS